MSNVGEVYSHQMNQDSCCLILIPILAVANRIDGRETFTYFTCTAYIYFFWLRVCLFWSYKDRCFKTKLFQVVVFTLTCQIIMQQILLFLGEKNTYTSLFGPTRLLISDIFPSKHDFHLHKWEKILPTRPYTYTFINFQEICNLHDYLEG